MQWWTTELGIRQAVRDHETPTQAARALGGISPRRARELWRQINANSAPYSGHMSPAAAPIKVLFFSDIHFDQHDEASLERLYDHLSSERFDHVIDGGDGIDAYSCSKYDKDPKRINTLGDELAMYKQHARRIESIVDPSTTLHRCDGNHEERIPVYLRRKAPALDGLRELSLPVLMGTEAWQNHDRRGVLIGDVRFKHGEEAAKGAGATARKELEKHWRSVVHGHIHRHAEIRVRKDDREFVGVEAGCMCRLNPEYLTWADWENSWVSLLIDYDHVEVTKHTP